MLQYNMSGIAPREVFMLQRDSDPRDDRYRSIWPFQGHLAQAREARRLLGRDVAARLGKALDPLLDVSERFEAGFDRVGRDISQHVGCDGVAQTVEIIDELTAACGKK